MNDLPTLFIRADADAEMGLGHVMRCLALGQFWKSKIGPVVFATCGLPDFLDRRLAREGIGVERINAKPASLDDAGWLLRRMGAREDCCVVIDGYQFDEQYQRAVNNTQSRVLIIDDNAHCAGYHADFLLNQNLHADATYYRGLVGPCELLLGTKYALLRSEFANLPEWTRQIDVAHPASRLLVSLGGVYASNAYQNSYDEKKK